MPLTKRRRDEFKESVCGGDCAGGRAGWRPMMGAAEVEFKSSCFLLFSKGDLLPGLITPLRKACPEQH
jgi:hypothetical protein